jgi:hypothetical protein
MSLVVMFMFMFSKNKLRGLYGFWTVGLFSIDIEVFESFLKEQRKEAKQALKHPQQSAANSAAAASSLSADSEDADEEVPDVDPAHEQLNLPPNSTTLWRIIPKLEYGDQVKT